MDCLCRPLSISSVCELDRSVEIAILYLGFLQDIDNLPIDIWLQISGMFSDSAIYVYR